jgi:hypothetical protein
MWFFGHLASQGDFRYWRRLTVSLAVLTFAASASLAQGVPVLRQAPTGQPTSRDFPTDLRKDTQPSSAPSQSATSRSSGAPQQRQTGRIRGGGLPTLQVGSSCEAAARGGVVLGRNKEACLADETDAQKTVQQNWTKYPATDKTICSGMTTAGGPASYVELLSCLEILRDAKSIGASDPRAGEMESSTSRAEVTQPPRVRNRRADRGRR